MYDFNNILNKKIKEINYLNNRVLIDFPTEDYIKNIFSYPEMANYGFVSQNVQNLITNITMKSDENVIDLYHQLVLIKLIAKSIGELDHKELPDEIKNLYKANFDRILKQIEDEKYSGLYNYSIDRFRKEIGICSFRLIPVGAQKINIGGISRQFLIKGNLSQFVKGTLYSAFELRGFKPLFEMHTDSNDPYLMSCFNENGWIQFYKRVAILLEFFPNVKGVFGSSWFFDPDLKKISPHLGYLIKIALNNGGRLFFLGVNEQSIKDATRTSKTRRRLYEEKKYLPKSYLLIWSRKKLIAWAKTKSKENSVKKYE